MAGERFGLFSPVSPMPRRVQLVLADDVAVNPHVPK